MGQPSLPLNRTAYPIDKQWDADRWNNTSVSY